MKEIQRKPITKKVIRKVVKKTTKGPRVLSKVSASGKMDAVIPSPLKVTDEKKRVFLGLAGAAGAGVILSSLFPKKAQALVLGSSPTSGVVGVKNSSNVRIDPATETTVAGVKTQTDKLTFDGSNKLTVTGTTNVKNASNSTINPATEDTLSAVKTQTDKLTFDVSNNLMVSGGGGASVVGLKDSNDTRINPATDDSAMLLRRLVRQVDSLAVVDSAQRQKVTVDAMTSGLTLSTVTTVTTVTTASNLTSLGGVDGRYLQMDTARNAYANGVRNNLAFS